MIIEAQMGRQYMFVFMYNLQPDMDLQELTSLILSTNMLHSNAITFV